MMRFTGEVDRRLLPETGAVHAAGSMDMFKQRNRLSQLPSKDKKQRPIPCQNRQENDLVVKKILGSSRAGIARIV